MTIKVESVLLSIESSSTWELDLYIPSWCRHDIISLEVQTTLWVETKHWMMIHPVLLLQDDQSSLENLCNQYTQRRKEGLCRDRKSPTWRHGGGNMKTERARWCNWNQSVHRWVGRLVIRLEGEGGVIAPVKKDGFYLLYIKKLPKIFFHGKITKSNKYFKIFYLVMEYRRGWRQGGQGRRKLSNFSSIGWQGTGWLYKFKFCFGGLSEIFFFLHIFSLYSWLSLQMQTPWICEANCVNMYAAYICVCPYIHKDMYIHTSMHILNIHML